MKQWDTSLSHFKTSQAIFTKLGSAPDVAYQLFCIGRVLSRMKRYREAEAYFFRTYKISDSLKIYKYLFRTSYELVNMYAQEGNWKDAYRYTVSNNTWQAMHHKCLRFGGSAIKDRNFTRAIAIYCGLDVEKSKPCGCGTECCS